MTGLWIIKTELNEKIWSGKRDSNSRPRPWQGRALPTELFPRRRHALLTKKRITFILFISITVTNLFTTQEIGAGNETRTRDPDLGKVVLYQLSYSRSGSNFPVLNRFAQACKFFIGTGCALYEKSVLPQAPESKKIIFWFKCRLKQQCAVFTST